jgi:STE24 endopeptidase
MTSTETAPDSARQQKAKEYHRLSRRGLFLELGIGAGSLLVLLLTGTSADLARILAFPLPVAAVLYLLTLAVGYQVIMAPLDYYHGFILSHRYGLSTQPLAGWLKDKTKASGLGVLLGLCLVVMVYGFMEYFPQLWWLLSALTVILLSLVLTRLTPRFLIPLFFKLKPLEEGELKERLLNLARRAGVNVKNVLTMNLSSKATTANAMVSGWGKSRRIIFSDTLLQAYPPEEVEVTLAHELGHHLHRDIARLIAIQAAVFLLGFYLASLALKAGIMLFSFKGITDLAALPWLILLLGIFMFLFQPLINWYDRRIELAADKSALELSNNPQAFINLMAKLTDQNLSEAEPSKWVKLLFYDHPTYEERVTLARNYDKNPG